MSRLAKIVPKPRGEYSVTETYNALDMVRYNRKVWMCKQDGTTGVEPAENTNWTFLVQDGNNAVTFNNVTTTSATEIAYQSIDIDGTENIIDGTVYMEQTVALSTSTTTNVTFTNSYITADSDISAFTSIPINYTGITVSAGSCVLTYPAVSTATNLTCRIYIRK